MTIYFAEMENDGWIKIGYTAGAVEKRIAQLQTGQPKKIRLIGTIPGEKDGEAGLHAEFSHLRGNGEWFEKCAELTSIISFLIDNQHPWYFCRAKRNYAEVWATAFCLTGATDASAYNDCVIAVEKKKVKPSTLKRIIALRKQNGEYPDWARKVFAECRISRASEYIQAWEYN